MFRKKEKLIWILSLAVMLGGTGCATGEQVAKEVTDQVENVTDQYDEHVLGVKNGYPKAIPQITYGQAFEEFFANPTWKYFKAEGGEDVVEFTGNCTYLKKKVKARLQFILTKDGKEFEQGALEFNGVPQSSLITSAMVYKAFEEYAKAHDINIDDDAEDTLGGDEDIVDYSDGEDSAGTVEEDNTEVSGDGADEEDYGEEDYGAENYGAEDYGNYGEYIFPESDTRYLETSDFAGLSKEELRLGRNEIYARYGRRFQDEELQEYFDGKSWYQGTVDPEDFDESVLNKYEKKNARMIKQYE